ncbi:hypothetical protein M0P65_05235 [Candidatus Gracilibacteria bacterium]|nr:hypothetical protein [Candidatus Gracilibacteria bacterium]
MIGYKATIDGYCLDKLYEIGKTYTLKGKLKMCYNGFHFCEDLIDVFSHYPPEKNIKIFKVEALGEVLSDSDKSVTNKIKILEKVNLSNLKLKKYGVEYHFDKNGNILKEKSTNTFTYKYDDNGNLIKYKTSYGYWEKWEYDKNNNLIKYKTSYGYWEKYSYDKMIRLIQIEFSTGYFIKYKYNKDNIEIKRINPKNF